MVGYVVIFLSFLQVEEMRAFINELEMKLEATENSLDRKRKESHNLRNSLNSITNADNDRVRAFIRIIRFVNKFFNVA